MARARTRATTAAAVLPASLAAALLVSAPFAGTTTAPLAHDKKQAVTSAAPGTPAGQSDATTDGISFDLPASALAGLAAAELALLGVGGGVIYLARRRRLAED